MTNNIILLEITRTYDTINVAIFKHKNSNTYSYVNLTKGHICPCIFPSIQDTLEDLKKYPEIISYNKVVDNFTISNTKTLEEI